MRFIVTRYNISSCWFGRKSSDTTVDPHVLNTIMSGFCKWVSDSTHMTQTMVNGTNPFKVYVKDCAQAGTDYAVGLWLSSADRSENVYAIKGDDPPNGEQHVEVLSCSNGNIPGMPAFFFVDATHNALYAVRPEKIRINGKPQFDAAIRFYMAHHAGTIERQRRVENDGTTVVELNMVNEDGETLQPRFGAELQKNPTVTEEILRRSDEIRKIVRVQDLSRKSVQDKRTAIGSILSLMGANLSGDEDVSDSRKLRCEIDVRLTRDEVERIIQRQGESSDERIGFRFRKESKPTWADTCLARKTITLNLDVEGPQEITARDLLEAIEQNRSLVVE